MNTEERIADYLDGLRRLRPPALPMGAVIADEASRASIIMRHPELRVFPADVGYEELRDALRIEDGVALDVRGALPVTVVERLRGMADRAEPNIPGSYLVFLVDRESYDAVATLVASACNTLAA